MLNIIGYITIIFILFIYSYIFGYGSIYFLYALIVAPIINYLLLLYMKSKIFVTVNIESKKVEKGSSLTMTLIIKNKGMMPIPKINIIFTDNDNLKIVSGANQSISLDSYEERTLEVNYLGKFRGYAEAGISDLILFDFLALAKKSIINTVENRRRELLILPSIFSIDGCDDLLNKEMIVSDSPFLLPNQIVGDPSYDFKAYTPGDPLNKVNWKISAKKNELFVRENEKYTKNKKIIILDPFSPERKSKMFCEDNIIEGVLSLGRDFYNRNYELSIYLYLENSWIEYPIIDDSNLISLQEKLALYKFMNSINNLVLNRFDSLPKYDGCDYILFSTTPNKGVTNLRDIVNEVNSKLDTIYSLEDENGSKEFTSRGENIWNLSPKHFLEELW